MADVCREALGASEEARVVGGSKYRVSGMLLESTLEGAGKTCPLSAEASKQMIRLTHIHAKAS